MSNLSKIMPLQITDPMLTAARPLISAAISVDLYKAMFTAHNDNDLAGKIRAVTKAASALEVRFMLSGDANDFAEWDNLITALEELRSHIFSKEWL
jgi:hypothetical protein